MKSYRYLAASYALGSLAAVLYVAIAAAMHLMPWQVITWTWPTLVLGPMIYPLLYIALYRLLKPLVEKLIKRKIYDAESPHLQ